MKLKFQEVADSYKMLHTQLKRTWKKNNVEVTRNNRNKTREENYIYNIVTNPFLRSKQQRSENEKVLSLILSIKF